MDSSVEKLLVGVTSSKFHPEQIKLTFSGFASVNWSSTDTHFDFVFGEERVCRVHPILAEFISPKVSLQRRSDACTSRYVFKDVSSGDCEAFESVISDVRSGRPIDVDESNFGRLIRITYELDNDELFSSLISMIDTSVLDAEECLSVLLASKDLASRCDPLIGFVASHFHELSEESLRCMDLEIARTLMSHPSLKVRDEDSLYEFVKLRSVEEEDFVDLLEFVHFEYLSNACIKDFVSFGSEHLLNSLNSLIWTRICQRLVLAPALKGDPRSSGSKAQSKASVRSFVYDSSKPLDGIISHLTQEIGGNVHDHGIVVVTASSIHSGQPKDIVDMGKSSMYTGDVPNSWICYDFKDRRVIPTSYSIRSHSNPPGGCQPKSWVFEGSNDKRKGSWVSLDRRRDNNELNDEQVTRNFSISSSSGESFRFLRLRFLGPNHADSYFQALSFFELFGTLTDA